MLKDTAEFSHLGMFCLGNILLILDEPFGMTEMTSAVCSSIFHSYGERQCLKEKSRKGNR